ncbi:hypothetical protein GYM69_04300 [Lactobacillus panisapium]|uniref:hypothetical protein n=1 Tax=Lactobacillus panisapium TaxID=2012495 RepID=UPI001C6A0915|nr:hypothetical protein [Lactobacillus panisapium]QYN56398.1 hypothetical protein GYM69_04300 [Lactobacillus panisapium]
MVKHIETATDWDAIYTEQLKRRANARYDYDILQSNGIGAYDRLQEQKLNKLHQFFVEFEQKYDSQKTPVTFIG